MTAKERAIELADKLDDRSHYFTGGDIGIVEQALLDERRAALEEAAKIAHDKIKYYEQITWDCNAATAATSIEQDILALMPSESGKEPSDVSSR